MPVNEQEAFYDLPEAAYPLCGVAGTPGDVLEGAVFEDSWEYQSVCSLKDANVRSIAVRAHL